MSVLNTNGADVRDLFKKVFTSFMCLSFQKSSSQAPTVLSSADQYEQHLRGGQQAQTAPAHRSSL